MGERIFEVPEDGERSEYRRDPRSGFVAYVPRGSLARGAELVKKGAAPCGSCHGEDLSGVGDIPGIRGRSPSYVARQFREGTRAGRMAAPMRAAVERLSVKDVTDISAHLASLQAAPAREVGAPFPRSSKKVATIFRGSWEADRRPEAGARGPRPACYGAPRFAPTCPFAADVIRAIAKRWFEVMRGCGDDVRELIHDGAPTACVEDAGFGYVNAFRARVLVGFFRGAELAHWTLPSLLVRAGSTEWA